MSEKDLFYRHLLQQCQSPDLSQRLAALEDLSKGDYLDLVPGQFLLDRLNSTSIEREQSAILEVMGQLPTPIPVEALLTILADRETSTTHLRAEVAHTLAVVKAKTAIAPLLRLLQEPSEDPDLRREIAEDLESFGSDMPFDVLIATVADPDIDISAAAMKAMSVQPSLIPIALLLQYRAHPHWYIREAVVKTLIAAGERVPIEPIIAALSDPEPWVRAAASFGCIRLLEWFGARVPLEPLLNALTDDYAPVRENILDALGKYPEHAPIEAITAALTDPDHPVRCAALDALGNMGDRVPAEVYPVLQAMSGADLSPHVRQRATRALLILHGLTPGPDKLMGFDPTLEELGE